MLSERCAFPAMFVLADDVDVAEYFNGIFELHLRIRLNIRLFLAVGFQ